MQHARLPGGPAPPTRFVDTEGSDTLFGYDAAGNLTDIKDAATPRNKATLAYNPDGTLASATDGRGKQTTFQYHTTPANQAGNLKTITPPTSNLTTGPSTALRRTSFNYDGLGRVSTMTNATGTLIEYRYDKLDRVTFVADYSRSVQFDFTYDKNGNLTQRVAAGSGTTTYGYDKLNRRTSEAFPGGASTAYGYDKSPT